MSEKRNTTDTVEALQKSEEKFRLMADNSIDVIWQMDLKLKFTYVSPSVYSMCGYTPEEWTGTYLYKHATRREFVKMARQIITAIKNYKSFTHARFEAILLKKNMEKIPVEIIGRLILNEKGVPIGLQGATRDISERKQAENALKKSETKYRTLIENTSEGFLLLDAEKKIREVNPALCEMLNYTEEEILGKSPLNFFDAENHAILAKQMALMESSVHRTYEICVKHKNGTNIPVLTNATSRFDKNGKPAGSFAMIRNITILKKIENALRASEEKYRIVFENTGTATCILEKDGTISLANSKFSQLAEYSLDEIQHNKTWMEFVVPEDLERVRKQHNLRRKNPNNALNEYEFRFISRNHNIHHIHLYVDMIPGTDKSVASLLDFTTRIRTQQALQQSEERFELAMNASQDGLFDWNLVTNEIYYSPGWKGMLGYAYDELPNDFSVWEKLTEPEDVKKSWQMQQEVILKKRDRFELEFKMRHKDGHWVEILSRAKAIFDENGTAIRFVGTHVDISAQKQVQSALVEKEERYRNLLENVGAGISYYDLEGTVILFNNLAAKQMNGKPADFVGKTLYEIYDPEYGALYHDRIKQAAKSEGFLEFEDKVELPLSTKWFSSKYNKTHDEKGNVTGVQIISNDITESKEAAIELEKLNATLEAAQRMAKVGYWSVNIESEQLEWSDQTFVLFGIKKENGTPHYQDLKEKWHPDDWETFDSAVNECMRGIPYNIIIRIWFEEDKSYHYINTQGFPRRDEHGTITEIFGTSQDITHLKKAEAALKASESRYKQLVDTASDAIYLIGENGNILDVNTSACTLLGRTRGEFQTLFIQAVDPNFSVEEFLDFWVKIPLDQQRIFETTHLTKEGKTIPVEVCGKKFRINGKIHYYALARDITDRKKAETEQKKLQEQLTQAQKMESVGRLAGGVAHDFNNMLSVIIGNADLALDDLPAESPLRNDLQEIRTAARRSADLTRQLLAFARRQTVTPQTLNLNEAISAMLKMLRRLIGEDIELIWQPTELADLIRIDPTQIDQILANLVVNAGDAIDGVGQIEIETATAEFCEKDAQSHADLQPGRYVMLSISDDGRGMDKKTINQIFEPFFTTKAVGQGTGLGLATVYGIVRQNRGFINVYSEPGQGTTFRIYLPTYSKPSVVGATSRADHKIPEAQGAETILLVEDESAILALGTKLLQKLGYRVLPAATPGEAIQLAREHGGEIQLLITDVIMPEMNGRDLAKRLLSLYPGLKRIYMSGYTADVIAHHGVLEDGVNFIQKPFSNKSLAQKVHAVLHHD